MKTKTRAPLVLTAALFALTACGDSPLASESAVAAAGHRWLNTLRIDDLQGTAMIQLAGAVGGAAHGHTFISTGDNRTEYVVHDGELLPEGQTWRRADQTARSMPPAEPARADMNDVQ